MVQVQHVSIADSDFCAANLGIVDFTGGHVGKFSPRRGRVAKLLGRSLGNDKIGNLNGLVPGRGTRTQPGVLTP
jgi:hypothetical protein